MINLKKNRLPTKGIITALVSGFLFAFSANYIGRTYDRIDRTQVSILAADSGLLTPKRSVLYFPNTLDKDSTGGLFYYTVGNKFYGRFSGITKPLATEDSVRAVTLERAMINGNTTRQNYIFEEVPGGAYLKWRGFTDYAKINFTSTGDASGNSNMVLTVGDNQDDTEGFIFQKDTANAGDITNKYDTLMGIFSGGLYARRDFIVQRGRELRVSSNLGTITDINGPTNIVLSSVGNNTNAGYSRIQALYNNVTFACPIGINAQGGNVGIGTNTPASKFTITGSEQHSVTVTNANGNITEMYYVVCTNTGPIGLNLPALSASAAGRTYVFKKNGTSASVTLNPLAGTIEGSSTYTFSTALASRTIFFDGTNWWVL